MAFCFVDYDHLKLQISQARDRFEKGLASDALGILEDVYTSIVNSDCGPSPEIDKIMAAARKLSGQVRGQMSQMVLRGPVMGLHTKEERQGAYTRAYDAYQKALRTRSVPEYNYALGYIEAIGDLLVAEAPDDKELLGLIGDMQSDLLEKAALRTEERRRP